MAFMDEVILIPTNLDKNEYDGFIECNQQSYRIYIKFMKDFGNIRIKCGWELHHKLKGNVKALEERMKGCSNPYKLASELQSLLKEIEEIRYVEIPVDVCEMLLSDLEALGYDKVKNVNKEMNEITLKATDSSGREHPLTVHLNQDYPKECPDITTDIPMQFRPVWGGELSNLSHLYKQFKEILPLYQRFWDNFDEIKSRCWILEPEHPTYNTKEIRLALGPSHSVLIQVEPLHPENPPECKFLGSETSIFPIRERYLNNIGEWNENLSLYLNLKHILKVDFPQRTNKPSIDTTLQCGICYAYRLNDKIPEQACNEARCGQLFHHECLVEWIRSIPGAKQSFQTLFGECPYCNSALTVKLRSRN